MRKFRPTAPPLASRFNAPARQPDRTGWPTLMSTVAIALTCVVAVPQSYGGENLKAPKAERVKKADMRAGSSYDDGDRCWNVELTGASEDNGFDQLCMGINNDGFPGPDHPMKGNVWVASPAGWSVDVSQDADGNWQMCLNAPTGTTITSDVTLKVCIKPNGEKKAFEWVELDPDKHVKWRYSKDGTQLKESKMARRLALLAVPSACPGDVNEDGGVDGGDLAILLGHWGGKDAGDINDDGIVDGDDLAIVLGGWGTCASVPCPEPDCLASFCSYYPTCCESEWDQHCQLKLSWLCGCPEPPGGLWQPAAHPCSQPSGSPSCADPLIGTCACEVDPYCCVFAWDGLCVLTAIDHCGAAPPELAILDVHPMEFTTGDEITITGIGFPESNPRDIHLSVRPWMPTRLFDGGVAATAGGGASLITSQVTSTTILARVGGVTPGTTLGLLTAQIGTGTVTVPPGMPPFVLPAAPGISYWSASTLSPMVAAFALPTFPSQPPSSPCHDFYGTATPLALDIPLQGPPGGYPVGTTIQVTVDAALLGGAIQFSQQMTLQTTTAMPLSLCAATLCQTIQAVFFQQTGLFFGCSTQVIGPDDIILSITPPIGDQYDVAQFSQFWVRFCP